MKKKRTRRLVAGMMAVLVTMFAFAGCSSKGEDSSQTVRMGVFPMPTMYLLQVFDEMKILEENGADVELVNFPVYSDCIQAFDTGQIDMIGFAVSESIAPVVSGVDCKVIGMFDKSNGLDGIVARKGINSLEELAGKTVATEIGTVDHLMLLKALENVGMQADDINVINMTAGDAVAALSGGSIDALSTWEPQLSLAAQNGNLIYTSKENPDLIPDIFLVHTDVLEEKYDSVKGILQGWYKGIEAYEADPDTYAQRAAEIGEISVEEFNQLMAGLDLTTPEDCVTAFTKGDGDYKYLNYLVQDVAEFLLDNELISTVPTQEQIDGMFDSRIITELANA